MVGIYKVNNFGLNKLIITTLKLLNMKRFNVYFFIILILPVFGFSQFTQLGGDIDGEAFGDQSGYSVSLSSDGNRVAVGAQLNDGNGTSSGHVRVYQLTNGSWLQLGADINGESAVDLSGWSVSLSADGNRVAIGAYLNDGGGILNSGHVRIYEFSNGAWIQLGVDIDGRSVEEQSGYSVGLSADGNRVVLGAYLSDGNGVNSGSARVFEFANGDWVQLGNEIVGEHTIDQAGWSVSISDNGNRVAVGSRLNDDGGPNAGHVRIFEFNSNDWIQLGSDIDGEAPEDLFGHSVSLNADGTRVAVGGYENDGNGIASGHTRIYEFVNTNWQQIGADIDGEAAIDRSGWSVSLNDIGNRVAIGAYLNDGSAVNSGHTRLYELNNGNWQQLDEDIDGEASFDNQSGWSVSLDGSGNRVAIGAYLNDGTATNSGSVEVFELSNNSSMAFITTWKTDNPGNSGNNQITIPVFSGETYNYSVDWGDGSSNTGVNGGITHTYATQGIYTVSLSGDFPRIFFNNQGDKQKILTVESWGSLKWTSMENAFFGCVNLDVTAIDIPDFSLASNIQSMFWRCGSLQGNSSFGNWEVSTITNMRNAFAETLFNQDVAGWDVSNVTDMSRLFANERFNQNISGWDVSKVTIMSFMFSGAPFNTDISVWDVSSVDDMTGLFLRSSFNQGIGNWDVSSVRDVSEMFSYCPFNQDIGNWDVSSVTNMSKMFKNNVVFNRGIGSWDVSSVGNMESMFTSTQSFQQDINDWNVSAVEIMDSMFEGSFYNQNIGGWNITLVREMKRMFKNAQNFNQDIGNWDVSTVRNMDNMFDNAGAFNQDIGNWDVSTVLFMREMFRNATTFDQNLEGWDVSSVVRMNMMFENVSLSIENYDALLTGWNSLASLQPNVVFDGGNSQYCLAEADRQNIIDTYGWTITDDGLNCPQLPFVTTWKTNNSGTSANNQITIPTFSGETYNYSVNWGDGSSDTGVSGDITHTYLNSGEYRISISGDFPRIIFNGGGDAEKLLSIEQWGAIHWSSMSFAFSGCSNLDVHAIDIPDFSNTIILRGMFTGCNSLLGNNTFNDWDISTITDIAAMFIDATSFNQPLENWDVSNIINMNNLFLRASNFNQPLTAWNVSNVTNMGGMFNSTLFNQDISNWDVSNVISMDGMFQRATAFNHNIGSWNVSNVSNMRVMFDKASSFNQDISGWNVSNTTIMTQMFDTTPFNQDIGSWDVGNVINMAGMFRDANVFNQDIGNWKVANVTSMRIMFSGAIMFNQNIGNWDVSSVTDMEQIFAGVTLSISNYDNLLIGWNTLSLQTNVIFDGGNSQFCLGENARSNIINTYGWIITDGGSETSPPIITCPENIITSAVSFDGANVTIINPTAFDNCSSEFIFNGIRNDGLPLTDIFPIGETTITWVANDTFGNLSEPCIQLITIEEFIPEPLSITGFFLVDSDTNVDIISIVNNSIIDFSTLPTRNLDIRVEATDDTQRVRFQLSGTLNKNRTDNSEPYLLYGNSGNQTLIIGSYNLDVTAFFGGNSGATSSISFEIIDTASTTESNILPASVSILKPFSIKLYPNPTISNINIKVSDQTLSITKIHIYDIQGKIVAVYNNPEVTESNNYLLPVYNISNGIYLVSIYNKGKLIDQHRFVIKR